MIKYIISPVTTYSEEEELYYTKIGIKGEGLPLNYIAVGKTEYISRERAKNLVNLLNRLKITVHH